MNKPHKKLDAWATAVDLAQLVCKTTDRFPTKEQFVWLTKPGEQQ
jgi:hypothetical protein